jgi:Arc/MetJ family transcription regulator
MVLPEVVVESDEQTAKQQPRTATTSLEPQGVFGLEATTAPLIDIQRHSGGRGRAVRQRRPNVYQPIKLYTSVHSMRTNIVIDDALMRQAMLASGARSKREAVELGLRTLVRLQQQAEIRSYRGQLQGVGDLEAQRLNADLYTATPADLEQDKLS